MRKLPAHSAVVTFTLRPEYKDVILAAACREGKSVSKFVLSAALERAQNPKEKESVKC